MTDADAMDRLAELVADGLSLSAAARRLGMSTFRRDALWARICFRLGEKP